MKLGQHEIPKQSVYEGLVLPAGRSVSDVGQRERDAKDVDISVGYINI